MLTAMRRATAFFSVLSLLACSDFKTSNVPQGDAGDGVDAGGDGAAMGDAGADSGPGAAPSDYACTGPWRGTKPPDPTCASTRKVFLVEGALVTTGGISIARTANGRVGISFDVQNDLDDEGLYLDSFLAPTMTSTGITPDREKVGFGLGVHVGHANAVAAGGGDDTLHLVYTDEDAQEVHYQRLEGGAPPLTLPELVGGGVGPGAYLSLAVSSDGGARVAYFVPGSLEMRSASRKTSGGFDAPSVIATGLLADAPGTGQSALLFDDQKTPNLLYQHCEVQNYSTPRFHTFDGAMWSDRKTIDNNVLDGYAGYSPSLANFGGHKYASYFFFKAGQSLPFEAEHRLADWTLSSDTPTVTSLTSAIPATSPLDNKSLMFRFRAALAVDKFGLLHLAIVGPNPGNTSGNLEYRRQTMVGGSVKWLSDIVDDDVLGDPGNLSPDAFVAITVDDAARPHIAYRSGKNGSVYYATRFDR